MNLRYLLWVLVLVLCAGCMDNMRVRSQADRLAMALDNYGADLRWGRYNKAYIYHMARDGKKPELNMARMENFSITSATPDDAILNADATEGVVQIEIKYYDKQYATLRTLRETQKWWFDAETNTWYTEANFPALK